MNRALHVVSWNVAGWSPTCSAIVRGHGSVIKWLDRHKIDVLCLQEVKISREKILSSLSNHAIPGFEGYWAPCSQPGKGLNGVATFVRSSSEMVQVEGVDFSPLKDVALDEEGRCIVTLHKNNVALVNIYAPNDGEAGKRLPVKVKFLNKVNDLMTRLKHDGRYVILAGDFNLLSRKQDCSWESRRINLMDLESLNMKTLSDFQEFIAELQNGLLHELRQAILSAEVYEADFGKWKIKLKKQSCADQQPRNKSCILPFSFFKRGDAECEIDLSLRSVEGLTFKPANTLSVEVFFEIINRCTSRKYSIDFQKRFAEQFGDKRCPDVTSDWLTSLLRDQDMRDCFLEFHNSAQDRFTCWEQYRNNRYSNKGCRIDYILADSKLKALLGAPLPLCGNDEITAIRCATADNRWKPAPMDGSGLSACDISQDAWDWEFGCSNPPRTGMIYTAPTFSDHIAVSALIEVSANENVSVSQSKMELEMGENLRRSRFVVQSGGSVSTAQQANNSIKTMLKRMAESQTVGVEKKADLIELSDSSSEFRRTKKRVLP